jgi:SAM-dependent methyltransferase
MAEVRKNNWGAQGVRKLTPKERLPKCEIYINQAIFSLAELAKGGKKVADIGCGFGRFKPEVENAGGEWVGIEPFEGGAATIIASAEDIPVPDGTFDVVFMNAVLEHVPDVKRCFEEVSRILKKDGYFVGYVAFMEAFHEVSYSHLSFRAVEHYAEITGMKLEKIAGGGAFGIDYHFNILFNPLPVLWMRKPIASTIRGIIKIKSWIAYSVLRFKRGLPSEQASYEADLYYKLDCMAMSNGFHFVIKKK